MRRHRHSPRPRPRPGTRPRRLSTEAVTWIAAASVFAAFAGLWVLLGASDAEPTREIDRLGERNADPSIYVRYQGQIFASVPGEGLRPVAGADPDSVAALSQAYPGRQAGKDRHRVHCGDRPLPGLDPARTVYLSNDYLGDGRSVWFCTAPAIRPWATGARAGTGSRIDSGSVLVPEPTAILPSPCPPKPSPETATAPDRSARCDHERPTDRPSSRPPAPGSPSRMKHHFGDLYEDASQYWTTTPNRERWSGHFGDLERAPAGIASLTLTGKDTHWERAKELPDLVELTLHEPNPAQVAALADFPRLTALRITHARPKHLDMLEGLVHLRELTLEYVSGFSDLGPVGRLPSLTALHLENLRRVSDFSGLGASTSLRYLAIFGTLDWNQPVSSFDFLRGMERLEHLRLGFGVRAPAASPVFASLLGHPALRRLEIGMATLPLEEYAWLEARLPHVQGAVRAAVSPDGSILLGKGQRMLSGAAEHSPAKRAQHEEKYRALVERYRQEA